MDTSNESDDEYLNYITKEDMEARSSIFDDITGPFTTQIGKHVSKKERESLQLFDSALIYGEIDFKSFATALLKVKFKYGLPHVGHSPAWGVLQIDGGSFVDLGSGTGKGVVAASLMHNFEHAYGIEILEGLHTLAIDVISGFNSRGKAKLHNLGKTCSTTCSVYHGDMLNLQYKDWRQADVVLANSTCFDEALLLKIADIAQGMKKGSFFISITRPIPGDDFTVLEFGLQRMSWGMATVYIAQKRTNALVS